MMWPLLGVTLSLAGIAMAIWAMSLARQARRKYEQASAVRRQIDAYSLRTGR